MNVMCCFTDLRPETERAVKSFAPDALFADTSGSATAYWEAIKSHWAGVEDLVVIEQDIVITADVVPSFKDCSELWCSYKYFGPKHLGYLSRSLGCTKFSAELQRLVSVEDILDSVFRAEPGVKVVNVSDAGDPEWHVVDVTISSAMDRRNIEPHVHGEVEHLHDYAECNVDLDYIDVHFKYGCDINPDGTFRLYKNNEDGSRAPIIPQGGDVKMPERKGKRCVVGRWL